MKTIKYLFWLIILGFLGILIYQNLDYFMAATAFKLDLKVAAWNWIFPELQNGAYLGICFLLGLILAGVRGFFAKLPLKKEIKTQKAEIASLKEQVNTAKSELEVFKHDPYIKKELGKNTIAEQPLQGNAGDDIKKGDQPETAD